VRPGADRAGRIRSSRSLAMMAVNGPFVAGAPFVGFEHRTERDPGVDPFVWIGLTGERSRIEARRNIHIIPGPHVGQAVSVIAEVGTDRASLPG
jgi:hypothetical protein